MDGFDFNSLKDYDVIAVNSAYKYLPNCKHIVALDSIFWEREYDKIIQHPAQKHTVKDYDNGFKFSALEATKWGYGKNTGLSRPPFVSHGFNSAHTAINIAINLGYTDIRILGMDLTEGYFYNKNAKHITADYSHMVGKLEILKSELPEHIKIVNYSEFSKSKAFERKPLTKIFE